MKTSALTFLKPVCLAIVLLSCQLALTGQEKIPVSDLEENREFLLRISNYDSISSVDWRKENNVKECQISVYKYKGNEVKDEAIKEITYHFNEDGIIQQITSKKGENEIQCRFDEDSRLIGKKIFNQDDTLQTNKYKYDTNGRLQFVSIESKKYVTISGIGMNEVTFISDQFYFDYTYNEQGLLSELMLHAKINVFDGREFEAYRERYVYNDSGQIVQIMACQRIATMMAEMVSKSFTEGQCSYKTENYYNEQGKLIKSTIYYPDFLPIAGSTQNKNPKGYFMWKFDEKGSLIEYHQYDENWKIVQKTINSFNANNNLTQKLTLNAEGAITQRIMQSFNENNALKMKIAANGENITQYMYGYKYDERGVRTEIIEYISETRKPFKSYRLSYK